MRPEPTIEKMASGNLSLFITEDVSWEDFPEKAAKFIVFSNGIVLKKMDTPAERLWVVLIGWRPFWLVFEDFPYGMSLDSMFSICNPVINRLHRLLTEPDSQNKRLC